MSSKRIANILTSALADRLKPAQQAELRNALSSLETTAQSVGEAVLSSRHISRVNVGNLVLSYAEGLIIINPETGKTTVNLESDGDARFGSDLDDVSKTSLFILATAQKYNGEDLGDGDVLFGDNSTGKANLLWDRSAGQLKFRGGLVSHAYIDTDGTLHASNAVIEGTITATTGSIGGWLIDTNAIYKTGIILDSSLDQIIVGETEPCLVLDGATKRIQTTTYASGAQGFMLDGATGNAEFNNITARGAIRASVITYGEIQATSGTSGVFFSAGKLKSDAFTQAKPTQFFLDIEDPPVGHVQMFLVGDILRIKDANVDAWMSVVSYQDMGDYLRYWCLLEYGSSGVSIKKGAAVADYGASGGGYITSCADGTIGSPPNLSIFTHTGSPWITNAVRLRMGNLNGSYGVVTNSYGLGVGDYSGGNYMLYNPSATAKFQIVASGGSFNINDLGVYFTGSGATGNTRSLWFNYYSGGTHYPMGGVYGDWGGSGDAYQWVKAQTSTGYPWTGATVVLAAIDYGTSPKDVRLYLRTNGDLTLGNVTNIDFSPAITISFAGATTFNMKTGAVTMNNMTSLSLGAAELRAGRVIANYGSTNGKAAIGEDPSFANYAGFWNASQTRTTSNFCLLQYYDGTTYLNAASTRMIHFQIANADAVVIDTTKNLIAENDVRMAGGLAIGTKTQASGDGDISMTGEIWVSRDATWYDTYTFHPLAVPLVSTSWDGDAKSDQLTSAQLDLSAVFGVPAGVKAVLMQIIANDSAAWGTGGLYFTCGPSSAYYFALTCRPYGGDVQSEITGPVPCDANGDVWYRLDASGASTMDVYIRIWGYWL